MLVVLPSRSLGTPEFEVTVPSQCCNRGERREESGGRVLWDHDPSVLRAAACVDEWGVITVVVGKTIGF